MRRHGRVMGKVPFSDSGHGVQRYEADSIDDWDGLRADLLAKGQTLLEEYIVQHPVLAAICPGTANTTRVTTFFDGEKTHVLSMAQKFGRGAASRPTAASTRCLTRTARPAAPDTTRTATCTRYTRSQACPSSTSRCR